MWRRSEPIFMKTKLTLLALFTALIACTASAGSYFRFYFTDSDGSEWYAVKTAASLESPSWVTNSTPIGTNAPTFGGHQYSIDSASNDLLMDGQVVGVIKWSHNTVDVTHHYGFAIDHAGVGWIMCQYNDGDPTYFLFSLDLATAEATYYDYIGPWCCACEIGCRQNFINGLVISQFP